MTAVVGRKTIRRAGTGPAAWHSRAVRVLVGGVNSPVRAFRKVGASPVLLTGARGVASRDVHGRAYCDLIMGWGALILGHGHPAVRLAVRQALERGALLGLTHPAEVELAELLVAAVPSIEQVRFTVSGTEACMTAIRLARAHTGRPKLVLFDGAYHGHSDTPMARQTAGIPASLEAETLSVPYNDAKALDAVLRRAGEQIACVIMEPVAANMGVVPPAPGFLAAVRRLTAERGILLIFDEVVTGFRLRFGAAQDLFGVRPDLTVFGKIIGGGLPIGAVGGPRRLLQRLSPDGDVYHGGTFAGHPLSMAAGLAALRTLKTRPPYAALERLSRQLGDGLAAAARRAGVPVQVNRVGSMMTPFFSAHPVTCAAEAAASDHSRFARWCQGLRARGILAPPSPLEALFLSTQHTRRDVERVLRASKAVFDES